MNLRERLELIEERIETAAKKSGRTRNDISLVAVTKTHPPQLLQQAIKAGIADFGENRIQEAEPKISELGRSNVRWHLIGHLQSNKARRAVQLFDVIHSLDSVAVARRLDRNCKEESREELPVLVQVDLAGEANKSGANESDVPDIVSAISESRSLVLTGLMTVPPFFDDVEEVRPYFKRLRDLRDRFQEQGAFGSRSGDLSMGMSHDFETAILEGATIVRIGTAIFGEREMPI